MKKLFALLLSVVLVLSMLTPAMAAYTAVTPANSTIEHSLQLTEESATGLTYDITYNFAVSENATIIGGDENGVIDNGNAVTGAPSIASITYTPTDTFSTENKTATKTLNVDWSGVSITQPGVYRWTVNQSFSTLAPQNPSNAAATFYLFLYVIDNGGNLEATALVSKADTISGNKTTTLPETYPAKTVDLTLVKNVSGNQASKEQYFPFEIVLTAPSTVSNNSFKYTITATTEGSYDINVPATAYHAAKTNLAEITVTNGTTGTFTLWLKHGQSVKINDMVYGTDYTIVEKGNDGYTVTAAASGHTDGFTYTANTYTSADASMTDDATVTYTNTKSTEVPTGIDMQTGAAFAGIILAMGLMIVMFIGKRKEQAC